MLKSEEHPKAQRVENAQEEVIRCRYFFHVRKPHSFEEDPEGVELPSNTAALEEAVLAAREVLANRVRAGDVVDGDEYEVRNEAGEVIHVIPLRSVLKLE